MPSFVTDSSAGVDLPRAMQSVAVHMKQELSGLFQDGLSNTLYSTALDYVACMCTSLMDDHNFDKETWDLCFSPYIGPFVGEYSKEASVAVLKRCHHDVRLLDGEEDDDAEGEDLCDCEFSLAYGGRMLLSQTKMRLKKRHRYGIYFMSSFCITFIPGKLAFTFSPKCVCAAAVHTMLVHTNTFDQKLSVQIWAYNAPLRISKF